MSQRIARTGIGLLVACALAAPAAEAGRPPIAGPRYTPQERAALIAYGKASFAEKQAILRGASPRRAELYDSGRHGSDGRPLGRGSTYAASRFPIAITVRPDGGLWEGSQFVRDDGPYEDVVLAGGKVGYVELTHRNARGSQGRIAVWTRGLVLIETSFAPTRSVRGTMARLRARLGDVAAGEVTPTRVAGYGGLRYDGRVTGSYHRFVPFSDSDGSKPSTDSMRLFRYQRFRVIVLDVRGRTVVVYVQSAEDVTKSASFPAFLPFAERILASLRFPPH
jgi:hypothetical protein